MAIRKLTALIGMAILATGCSVQPVTTPDRASFVIAPTNVTDVNKIDVSKATNERERMLASLNLSDSQKAQLEELRLQNRPKIKQIQAQIKQLNASILQLPLQIGITQASFLNLYQQKHALTLQEQALHLAYEQKFLAILTPAQQVTYYRSLPENKYP